MMHAHAQTTPADLVGTWTSKANSTMTGPVCSYTHVVVHLGEARLIADRASTIPSRTD